MSNAWHSWFHLLLLISVWVDMTISVFTGKKLRLKPAGSTYLTGMWCLQLWTSCLTASLFSSLLSLHPWDYVENSEEWQLLSWCRLCNHCSLIHQRHLHPASYTQIPLGPDLPGCVSKLSHISTNARSSLQFLLHSQLDMSQNSHRSRRILRTLSQVNQVYAAPSCINWICDTQIRNPWGWLLKRALRLAWKSLFATFLRRSKEPLSGIVRSLCNWCPNRRVI